MRRFLGVSILSLMIAITAASHADDAWFRVELASPILLGSGGPPSSGTNDNIAFAVVGETDKRVYGGLSLAVTITGVDASYSTSVAGLPSGATWTLDPASYGLGTIAWPSAAEGTHALTVEVRDGSGAIIASQTVLVTVYPPLAASVHETAYAVDVGVPLTVTPDIDNEIGSVLWGSTPSTLPDWLDFDARTGVIDVNTSTANTLSNVVLTAVDQADTMSASTLPFSITVNASCDLDGWVAATAPTGSWSSIAYGDGLFVAVGSGSNRVMTSPDGINWTARSAPSLLMFSVAYGNGMFVAAGADGKILTSTTGTSWTLRSTPVPVARSITNAFFGNGKFVLNDNVSGVIVSANGIDWTYVNHGVPNGTFSTAYGAGKFVTVTNLTNNRVLTSTEGLVWTSHQPAELNNWTDVAYGKGLFVAIAGDGSNRIMTSPDGTTWTARPSPEQNGWNSITYGDGMFTAVASSGTNRIMTSPNGIDWTLQPAPAQNSWYSVAHGGGKFVALSYNGTNPVMASSCM
jgi:hypothetical protein